MAATIPEWLTEDFFKSCLESEKGKPQTIKIIDHTVNPVVADGNSYGSSMFEAKIKYTSSGHEQEEYSVSLIIKAPLIGGFVEQLELSKNDVYEKEPKFYNEFINETYKLSKHNIVPRHYKSPNPLCVVLEDLSCSGYTMVDRHELLDFDHCQLYVKASSKLHAMSVAVNKKHPKMIESLGTENPIVAEKAAQVYKGSVIGGLRCMAAYLENKPDYEDYFEFIKQASENEWFWNIFQEMEKEKKSLNALVQVDPWCTNMMFKYSSSGEVTDIKIFDFQNLKFTTPIREFITFIWVSAHPEVRKTKLDDLYHLYCDSLNESLAGLGCSERLSIEELRDEIAFFSPLVILIIFMMVPVCTSDGIADLNDFYTGDILNMPIKETTLYKLYQGLTFNKYLPHLLDQAANEGVFEYLKDKFVKFKSRK